MPVAFLSSPPVDGWQVGPLFVHAYGLAYVVGIWLAVRLIERRWAEAGGERALIVDVAVRAVPAGLAGGRLYFLLTSWDQAPHTWWGPLAIWDGGLGIWGGIFAGTLTGLWVLRRRGIAWGGLMDAAAPGLLVAQGIGRIGNYFNQELFGGPTSLPWGLRIDFAHRPAGYGAFTTFQPTFLYELLFDLALAGALVQLGRRRPQLAPGTLFGLYVTGYSAFRIFEESLRIDPAHHLLGLRLNLFVAVGLTLAGLAATLGANGRLAVPRVRWLGLLAVGAGAAAIASGCGSGHRTNGNAVDRAFVDQIVPHHQLSVEMAADTAQSPRLRTLGAQIGAARRAQLAVLSPVAAGLGVRPLSGVADGRTMRSGPMADDTRTLGIPASEMDMTMDIGGLGRAAPFDRAYIDTMIPYQQCEIRMARAELARGSNPALRAVAQQILAAQPRELTELNALRTAWYGTPSPAGGLPS